MKEQRLIVCRSQSEALSIRRRLEGCGIESKLTRPPRSAKTRSCSWGIAIQATQSEQAEACLHRAKIPKEVWCWEDS